MMGCSYLIVAKSCALAILTQRSRPVKLAILRTLRTVESADDAAVGLIALAEVAWSLATPFTTWWAEHPQYHRRNTAA